MRLMSNRPSEAPPRVSGSVRSEPDRLERVRICLASRRWMSDSVLCDLPVALRRPAPLMSSTLIAGGFLLSVLTMIGPNLGIVAVPLTIYSTTAFGTRAHGRIVLGLGFVGALLLGGWLYLMSLQATIGPDSRPLEAGEYLLLATIVALCAAIVFIAWLLGGVIHRRRAEIEGVRERNRLLERERESETR